MEAVNFLYSLLSPGAEGGTRVVRKGPAIELWEYNQWDKEAAVNFCTFLSTRLCPLENEASWLEGNLDSGMP